MKCPTCKGAALPCEAHSITAGKLGRLSANKLARVFKIHSMFCYNPDCDLIRCRYYKDKLKEKFPEEMDSPLQVIDSIMDTLSYLNL